MNDANTVQSTVSKQNQLTKIHKNKIINHLKKYKTIFKKKTSGRSSSFGNFPEEVALPESSSEIFKGHPEEPFFRKLSGRTTSDRKSVV